MDQSIFLERHNLTEEDLKSTGLPWSVLHEIQQHHVAASQELQTTARYITERLQLVPAVHSLKLRIKDPEHLIAKIIRKKLKNPALTFDVASYEERITDLIGIRALHLFKGDWEQIHQFVTATWDLAETPVAYVRTGDADALIAGFNAAGCDVQKHPFGYRSIHYQIKSQPAKRIRLAELQVRTIFEEGWSEIDHRVRYPRHSDDPYLAGLLTIFNRLAGGADEMGTFTELLSTYLTEQAIKEAEKQRLLGEKEEQLKRAVSLLKISESEKNKLENQITELRQSLMSAPVFPDVSQYSAGPITSEGILKVQSKNWAESGFLNMFQKTCQVCGKTYSDFSLSGISSLQRCPECVQSGWFRLG